MQVPPWRRNNQTITVLLPCKRTVPRRESKNAIRKKGRPKKTGQKILAIPRANCQNLREGHYRAGFRSDTYS